MGYRYVYAQDIAPDGEQPERNHYGEVLLAGRLEQALKRINPKLSPAVLLAALKEVLRINSPEILPFPIWPGPHTWLMPASRHTPRWLRGRHESIAVRVTAHPDAAGLCRALGTALVSTSANRAGLKPLKTYAACVKAFGQSVLVLPGRIGSRKTPSTIQHLLTGKIIRP